MSKNTIVAKNACATVGFAATYTARARRKGMKTRGLAGGRRSSRADGDADRCFSVSIYWCLGWKISKYTSYCKQAGGRLR